MSIHVALKHCLLLSVVITLWQCGKDDEAPNIQTANADALTKGLDVPNSTLVNGVMPASSPEANAPVLEDVDLEIVTVPGATLIIPGYPIGGGEVKGFYLQIDGASKFFDITPVDPPITGRVGFGGRKKVESPYFLVHIPSNISPGSFCMKYAGYDYGKRAGNVIHRCVTIRAMAGSNSNFLTQHAWTAIKEETFYAERMQLDTYTIGDMDTLNLSVGITCNGLPANAAAEILDKTYYDDLTFTNTGKVKQEKKFYSRTVDITHSNCTPTYQETEGTDIIEGYWSYDDVEKKLYLVVTDEVKGSTVGIFSVTFQNDQLILEQASDNGDYYRIYYRSK
jgi:hypothetical protein